MGITLSLRDQDSLIRVSPDPKLILAAGLRSSALPALTGSASDNVNFTVCVK